MMIIKESSGSIHQSLKIFLGFPKQYQVISEEYSWNVGIFKVKATACGVEFGAQVIDKQCKEERW